MNMTTNEGFGQLMRQWAATHGRKVQPPPRSNAITTPERSPRTAQERKDRKQLTDELATREHQPGRGGVDYGQRLDLHNPTLQQAIRYDHDRNVTHHGLPCCENRNGDAGS